VRRSGQPKPSRRERERQRHRREILRAAEIVFARKGFEKATIAEIAQEADFSVGTIYNLFEDKEDLYACAIENLARAFIETFEREVLTKDDPWEAIGTLIELRLTLAEGHRRLFQVVTGMLPPTRVHQQIARAFNRSKLYDGYVDALTGIFARGVADGTFRDVDPMYLTMSLEGLLHAAPAYWARREPPDPLPIRAAKIRESFLACVRGPRFEESPGASQRR